MLSTTSMSSYTTCRTTSKQIANNTNYIFTTNQINYYEK